MTRDAVIIGNVVFRAAGTEILKLTRFSFTVINIIWKRIVQGIFGSSV